jgi:soluble lytic murein transglycosylase-like protein
MDTVYDAAVEGGVDPALALAVAARESSFNPGAVSSQGAQGLMQLMPDTAARYGVTDAFDPQQNAAGGVAYLKFLDKKFDGNLDLVLAAYNAGEGAVQSRGNTVPPFAETEKFVEIVGNNYKKLAEKFDQDEQGGTGGF